MTTNGRRNTVFSPDLAPLIKEYEVTQDPECFYEILLLIDKLILRMIHQLKSKYSVLREISMRDLYQTAILSLYEALDKFKIDRSSVYSFPRYLQGYIQKDLLKMIRQHKMYMLCGLKVAAFDKEASYCRTVAREIHKTIDRMDLEEALKDLRAEGRLSPQEEEMLNLKYDGYSCKAIAERLGSNEVRVRKRLQRLAKKIRKALERRSFRDKRCLFIGAKATAS